MAIELAKMKIMKVEAMNNGQLGGILAYPKCIIRQQIHQMMDTYFGPSDPLILV